MIKPNTVIRCTKLTDLEGRLVYRLNGLAHEVRFLRGRYYTTGNYIYL